jgi:hypothetical protein
MITVRSCAVPDATLLQPFGRAGGYADCYATEIDRAVSHAQFVEAFYTTSLFRLERWLLGWLVSRPSTDAQAAALAAGESDSFSAWRVEGRAKDELLVRDFSGRTLSWLRVVRRDPGTTLYFGSAVVPGRGFVFRALLGFHKLYSRALLRAARSRLASRP